MAEDLGGALLSISMCLQYWQSKSGEQIKTQGGKKKTMNADIENRERLCDVKKIGKLRNQNQNQKPETKGIKTKIKS